MNRRTTATLVSAGAVLGIALGMPIGAVMTVAAQQREAAHASSITVTATPYRTPEDSPAWDCRTDGNRICGPENAQRVVAGCYSDTGTVVALWPCHVVVNSAGDADVYEGPAA